MCGSPDHLIRECPHAKTGKTLPSFQLRLYGMQTFKCSECFLFIFIGNALVSGGIPPFRDGYWHGVSFSNARPYANIYGAPPMMPFDPMMFPAPAFGIPSCLPPIYGGLATP